MDDVIESCLEELNGARLVLGDFRGFILNRNCNLFDRKRLVFESGIASCNTQKECRNPGFGDSEGLFGDD